MYDYLVLTTILFRKSEKILVKSLTDIREIWWILTTIHLKYSSKNSCQNNEIFPRNNFQYRQEFISMNKINLFIKSMKDIGEIP